MCSSTEAEKPGRALEGGFAALRDAAPVTVKHRLSHAQNTHTKNTA